MRKRILVTGASGFIGSFIVEGGLDNNYDVWAGIRKSSSRRFLKNNRINFAELDFSRPDVLKEQLKKHKEEHNGWDYIVHCAGVTKCLNKQEFYTGNFLSTKHFIEVLMQLDMVPHRFIYISSLSVFGPIRENDYTEIREDDKPAPNTAYGDSKLKSEQYIMQLKDFPFVIFRPTGVYGPREKDYFLMASSIKKHTDFAAGFKRQDITFVYVKDIVHAIYAAIDHDVNRRAYFLSDGEVYNSRTFSDLIKKELGDPWLLRITCPLIILKAISCIAEKISHITKKPSTLNSDKYNIMKQRNWRCDIGPAQKEFGYNPQYKLDRGVKEIITWYKKEKWL